MASSLYSQMLKVITNKPSKSHFPIQRLLGQSCRIVHIHVYMYKLSTEWVHSELTFCLCNFCFPNMLLLHTFPLCIADLWLNAAKYEFEHVYSMESARHVLMKGLSFNKESQLLWHEVCLRIVMKWWIFVYIGYMKVTPLVATLILMTTVDIETEWCTVAQNS